MLLWDIHPPSPLDFQDRPRAVAPLTCWEPLLGAILECVSLIQVTVLQLIQYNFLLEWIDFQINPTPWRTPNHRNLNSGGAKSGIRLSCHVRELTHFAGCHKCSFCPQPPAAELKGRSTPRSTTSPRRRIFLFPRKHISSASQVKAMLYPQSVLDLLTKSKEMNLGAWTCCAASGTKQTNSLSQGRQQSMQQSHPQSLCIWSPLPAQVTKHWIVLSSFDF